MELGSCELTVQGVIYCIVNIIIALSVVGFNRLRSSTHSLGFCGPRRPALLRGWTFTCKMDAGFEGAESGPVSSQRVVAPHRAER
ncbi:hypothetical protein ES703_35965 [subsurface metagenome]